MMSGSSSKSVGDRREMGAPGAQTKAKCSSERAAKKYPVRYPMRAVHIMWAVLDSNQRPLRCERSALTS
jgi:hypothetical protein